jgi:serine/threonine protein kinase
MGEVYLAEDVTTGQKVALKLLQHRASKQARLRRRFERESTLIQDLQHDHIVPLLASGVDDGTQFLVMRYINGQTLADRIVKENGNADTRPIRRDQTATPTTRESVSKPRVPPAIPSSSLPNRLPMWRMHCKSLTTNGSSTATSNLLT